MPTRTDFQILAKRRLAEAQSLFGTNHFDGAYYLGGYAIEFALKAAICKALDWEVFNERDASKAFQIHDLSVLAVFSGLWKKLQTDRGANTKEGSALYTQACLDCE